MTETTTTTAATQPEQPAKAKAKAPGSLIIRPWPKVVFLYPTFIASLVCWLWSLLSDSGGSTGAESIGNWFVLVLFLNLLVFSFDFSRIWTITLAVGLTAVVLAIGWAGWFAGLSHALARIDIRMNTQFYGFLTVFLALILALVFLNTRFNYYELNHRELLHHHGYLGDITRMPTSGLLVQKEIYDLFEYALLRSGRLIFYTPSRREAIVIENVLSVNKVEDHIKDLLSVLAVRMTEEGATAFEP